jgi:hypothetical protein
MKPIEETVGFGLDRFGPYRTIEIPLRDALYAFKAIGEFIAFFHQPQHYPDLQSVEKFIGDVDAGGLHVLWEAYYMRLRDVWPPDVSAAPHCLSA